LITVKELFMLFVKPDKIISDFGYRPLLTSCFVLVQAGAGWGFHRGD